MNYKKLSALFLAGVMAVSAAGCSKTSESSSDSSVSIPSESAAEEDVKEASELIEKAKERVNSMASYNADMHLDFEFVNTQGTAAAAVTTEIKDLTEPVLKSIKIHSESADTVLGDSQFYVDEENGQKVVYMRFDGKWYKSNIDDDMLYYLLGQYDMKDVFNTLLVASSGAAVTEEEEINGVSTKRIDAVVDEELVANTLIYTGVFVAAGMATLTPEYFEGAAAMPISFWIDEEGNVLRVSFDAGSAYQTISDNLYESVKDTEGYENAQKLVINTYNITVDVKDIDRAERFDIPEEVLAAEEMEEPQSEETIENSEDAVAE